MAPLFLVGESYGTTRASGLSNWLFDHGIALNGIALVSAVMNFQTIRFNDNNDLPLILMLPSYTATAWYHKKLPAAMQSKSVAHVVEEARKFPGNQYRAGDAAGIDSLSLTERISLLEKYSIFTGLSKDFIDRNNFRVELGEFNKELLRSEAQNYWPS